MIIHEDALCRVEMEEKGVAKGDVHIFSKKDARSVDDLSAIEFTHCMTIAKITASVLFELTKAHGTNILVQEQPFSIRIITRMNEDTLGLKWDPKQIEAMQMNEAFEKIKDKTFFIGEEPSKSEPTLENDVETVEETSPAVEEEHDDYLIKQLYRIP